MLRLLCVYEYSTEQLNRNLTLASKHGHFFCFVILSFLCFFLPNRGLPNFFFNFRIFEKAKRQEFFDDLSDQNMSEHEHDEKMTPKSMKPKLEGGKSFHDEKSDKL